jgi:uncharacterized protein GlcG (DUF336 family)
VTPIRVGAEIIGAIGVAGYLGSVHEEECADAGLAQIERSLS